MSIFLSIFLLALLPLQRSEPARQVSEVSSSGFIDSAQSKLSGSYFSGKYSNLFTEVLSEEESAVKAKVDSAFDQLFYGDSSTQRIYCPVEPDMAYIYNILNNDVRTEGMSYGMMISVQLNKKKEFDRLWKWSKTYMQQQNGPHRGFFAWHCKTNGSVIDSNAASDGEEWFVMALFFASARWGNGTGIYNYRAEAQAILDAMLHKEEEPDNNGRITNMFNKKEKQVVFVPMVGVAGFTDPSYHLPHFYELWARWADKDNRFWCDAAFTSRQFLKKAANPSTGLMPDYAHFDGSPINPWGGGNNDFRFDAWRVAMNVAVDYAWFARDDWSVTQSNRLLNFFYSEGMYKYGELYTLDGKRLTDNHSSGLIAMNGVACLVSTNENRKEFLKEFWNTPVPSGIYRYYNGMLYMLGLLHVSGNFRIYDPTGGPVPACSDGLH